MATLYTIGHSTRSLDELIGSLQAHSIESLSDVRSFPMSRRLPHFNRESLEKALPAAGIQYLWMKDLGGRRKKSLEDSPNVALRNESFRNYADYMLSQEFERAIADFGQAWRAVPNGLYVRRAPVFPLPSHAGFGLVGGAWA